MCGAPSLGSSTRPCVVYSFGSYDDISFEVGLREAAPHCEIHVFDIDQVPSSEAQRTYNFTSHRIGLGVRNTSEKSTLESIMKNLRHSYTTVLKLDIERAEESILPQLHAVGYYDSSVDQLLVEFHSLKGLKKGLRLLEEHFQLVYARKEDRCPTCTEVALVRK